VPDRGHTATRCGLMLHIIPYPTMFNPKIQQRGFSLVTGTYWPLGGKGLLFKDLAMDSAEGEPGSKEYGDED
jgi:hypothetical protein